MKDFFKMEKALFKKIVDKMIKKIIKKEIYKYDEMMHIPMTEEEYCRFITAECIIRFVRLKKMKNAKGFEIKDANATIQYIPDEKGYYTDEIEKLWSITGKEIFLEAAKNLKDYVDNKFVSFLTNR